MTSYIDKIKLKPSLFKVVLTETLGERVARVLSLFFWNFFLLSHLLAIINTPFHTIPNNASNSPISQFVFLWLKPLIKEGGDTNTIQSKFVTIL